jgi:7,8-dihydropterin-6-yl-methyl-4-(beta-D-ribofuranosyl)aminobenzene 5'-phosphate synthase
MSGETVDLKPVDRIEIVVLADNYADVLLESTDSVTRPPKASDGLVFEDTLVAEHGLSLLVRAVRGEETREILLDAGYSSVGVPHNLDRLGISLDRVEAVVLSHGHMDHTGALPEVLERIPNRVSLVAHPDAFAAPRYIAPPGAPRMVFPHTLVRENLDEMGADVTASTSPLLLAGGTVLVTGQVERTTPYEQGMPHAVMERDGEMVRDEILDDQSLVLSLRGKGLVVVAGCSHAGVVNTVRCARRLTGEGRVHAILGGFHLADDPSGELVESTIQGLKEADPDLLMPMHCTGWEAVHRIAEAFPSVFALSSVGTTVTLRSA